jgi:hypothetical protein
MGKYYTNAPELYFVPYGPGQPTRVLCVKKDGEILVDTAMAPKHIQSQNKQYWYFWYTKEYEERTYSYLEAELEIVNAKKISHTKTELGLILKEYFTLISKYISNKNGIIYNG